MLTFGAGCASGVSGADACLVVDEVNESFSETMNKIADDSSLIGLFSGSQEAKEAFLSGGATIMAGSVLLANLDTSDDGVAEVASRLSVRDYRISDIMLQLGNAEEYDHDLVERFVSHYETRTEIARLGIVACALR